MVLPSVLFVDDDPNFLKALRRAFSREEWRFRFVDSGAAALEAFAKDGPFDVVVADQRMPGMTGVELLRTVRRINPSSVRVILSGYADIEHVLDAINEGHVYKFLMKDIAEEALRETLRDVVASVQLARENRRLTASLEAARLETEAAARLAADIEEMDFDPVRDTALGAALEALPAGGAVTGPNGELQYANREARRLLGLSGQPETNSVTLESLLTSKENLAARSSRIDGAGSRSGLVWFIYPKAEG